MSPRSKSLRTFLVVVVAGLMAAGLFFLLRPDNQASKPDSGDTPAGSTVLATDLDIPWQVAVLPDGDLLVTERSGQLKRIGNGGASVTVPGVYHVGEGGLLGLALHPDYKNNRWVYMYLTQQEDGRITNRVDRYRYQDGQLVDRMVMINAIPGARFHDGGALAFGPDGMLYITTGDANDEPSAQDTTLLSGKILRITDEGKIPQDNPFGNAVYSYGHRNPQGLAWDEQGRLWATEHGPSGLQSGHDELNRIIKGGNYGWPEIKGDESKAGMRQPIVHSGPDVTWAPAGIAYKDGVLYFAGLRGSALYSAAVTADGNDIVVDEHIKDVYGRLRGVTAEEGRTLLVTTSNRDGRGDPVADDDRIIEMSVDTL